jgi:hypothetical protein
VTKSGGDGNYRLAVPALPLGSSPLLFVDAPAYLAVYKSLTKLVDQSLDFELDPLIDLNLNQPLNPTIWGHEFLQGDSPGRGFCTARACKPFDIDGALAGKQLVIRLQWSDPTAEVALYVPRGELNMDRYCCTSQIVVSFSAPSVDWDNLLFVGFERRAGNRPSAADSVRFTLVVEESR